MAEIYTTRTGDMLDAIAWRAYGPRSGAFEAVLAANRSVGAALTQPVLNPGLTLTLPALDDPDDTAAVAAPAGSIDGAPSGPAIAGDVALWA